MAANLITLQDVVLAFGHHPLLDHASLTIQENERIGLIGRNGTGKSSLLKLIAGELQADQGEVKRRQGVRIALVEQEPELPAELTTFELLAGNYIEAEDWQRPALANRYIDELGLSAKQRIGGLSGGMRKRLALAQALIEHPDLLLLDEPTNHLDFEGIRWLEELVRDAGCTFVIITHDRRFLDTITTHIVELDRGQLLSFPGNYSKWQSHKQEWLAAEALEQARADKFLAQEEVWIRTGVQARRTRNEGRVRRLERLRRERAERRERQGNVALAVAEGRKSGKLVAELENISHQFDTRTIIDNFSTTIMRGDRIGIVGPNGCGKTTLLKIILGILEPDQGFVKHGTNLTIGYFDQMRDQLDENKTLVEAINPGSEWIEIGNQRKHVMRYLEDFLFSPARSQSPVSTLSGGERARLLLARLFAKPTNILVMDEPTNDLDIETLELLEELLQDYSGTVLLVSHDRTFLNNVVTQSIVYLGQGQWQEYVGGYDDWVTALAQAQQQQAINTASRPAQDARPKAKPAKATQSRGRKPDRLTSWEERELADIPEKIAAIEKAQAELASQLADPELYKDAAEEIPRLNARNEELEADLQALFERWEELEEKAQASR